MAFELVELDTGSILRGTFKDSKTSAIINITGATIILRYKIGIAAKVEKTMSIELPATNGIAIYQFLTGELDSSLSGHLVCEVTITDSGGKDITSVENVVLPIKKRIA